MLRKRPRGEVALLRRHGALPLVLLLLGCARPVAESCARSFVSPPGLGQSPRAHRSPVSAAVLSMVAGFPAIAAHAAQPASSPGLDFVEGASTLFFALSLFPYLAFLYFLTQAPLKTPSGVVFGFAFLLVFVLVCIPAGIFCKSTYGLALSDVDAIHGAAESFLTLTNLFLALGLRQALRELPNTEKAVVPGSTAKSLTLGVRELVLAGSAAGATAAVVLATGLASSVMQPAAAAAEPPLALAVPASWPSLLPVPPHREPWNSLSVPTWTVHWSSLVEWLLAQDYVWEYGCRTGNLNWAWLAVAMAPLHTAGTCAVAYHAFYNAPAVEGVPLAQAILTCLGNVGLALAAWNLLRSSQQPDPPSRPAQLGIEVKPLLLGSDVEFLLRMLLLSVGLSLLTKFGSPYLDLPFQPSYQLVAVLVAAPTALNCWKWFKRAAPLM